MHFPCRPHPDDPGRATVRWLVLFVLMASLSGCNNTGAPTPDPARSAGESSGENSGTDDAATTDKGVRPGGRKSTSRPSQGPVEPGPIRFADVTAGSGIDFVHVSGDFAEKPFPAANGSGLALFDFDLDGLLDVYFLTGSRAEFDPEWTEHPQNRCYRNRGEWKFEEVTAPTGLGYRGYSAGVAVGDFDSDGFPDVFVNCYGADRLYRNQGDGTFVDVSDSAGVAADTLWGTSATFLDFDGDGLLDLLVANYAVWSMETNKYCGDRSRGVRTFCGPSTVDPAPVVLYHNNGEGGLVPVTERTGVAGRLGRGQGVLAADINQDGWTDLYIANDMNPNSLFVNDGQGAFRDVSADSGTDLDYKGAAQAGMGIALADGNRDGRFDLFVTNYEGEHNAYYEAQGDLQFQDVSRSRGLAAESIPWVGWGTTLADFDLDGWPDCLVTNGHTDNNFQEMGRDSPYEQRPGLWHNRRGRFISVGGESAGGYFAATHVGRGLAVGDLDNDGDLDVVIGHQDSPPALLRNDSPRARTGTPLVLRLIGRDSNRDAIGAVVREPGGELPRVWSVSGGGSYASASDPRVNLGLAEGESGGDRRILVRWPGGAESEHVFGLGGGEVTIRQPAR